MAFPYILVFVFPQISLPSVGLKMKFSVVCSRGKANFFHVFYQMKIYFPPAECAKEDKNEEKCVIREKKRIRKLFPI